MAYAVWIVGGWRERPRPGECSGFPASTFVYTLPNAITVLVHEINNFDFSLMTSETE